MPRFEPLDSGGRNWVCRIWVGVVIVVAAVLVGGAVFGTITGVVMSGLAGCKETFGTRVPTDPSAVVIAAYPDTDCAYPFRGVAGVLEPVDEGRVLYISNCHNLHLLHTVDPAAATVYTEPIAHFAWNLVGSHGITVCTSWNNYYVIGSLNGHKLYTLVLDDDQKVAHLHAVDVGYRIRSIAPLDDCAALLLTEPDPDTQGPLIRVNTCGRNRLYGDPDHV